MLLGLVTVAVGVAVRFVLGRIFAMGPRLQVRRGALVASTSLKTTIMTLGMRMRTVTVDPRLRHIRIENRTLWLFRRVRRIPFEAVKSVLYDWNDVNPFHDTPMTIHQELDLYVVSVSLEDGRVVELCRFFGLGDWVNEHYMPDWVFWDDMLAAELARGSQEEESRAYALLIAQAIGVPLERA